MNYHETTLKILEDLGINGKIASKVMGISHTLYGNKYSKKSRNKFTERDYKELIEWLKGYLDNIEMVVNN